LVVVEAQGDTESLELGAIDAAFAAFERVACLLHPVSGHDVRLLSQARIGEPVRLDPWSYEVLRVCRELHVASGGVFDPCLPREPGRMSEIDLSREGRAAKGAALAIDLGGIAKGFAVDRAIDALRRHGCVAGLVNAGGDLRVFGSPPRDILLRSSTGALRRLELDNEAAAVSEPKSERSPSEHVGYYVGTTGQTVVGRWVAVSAPSATLADGLSKCVMLCAPDVVRGLLAEYRARALFA